MPTELSNIDALARPQERSVMARRVPFAHSPYSHRALRGATLVPRMLFFVEVKDPAEHGRSYGRSRVISARSAQEREPWRILDSIDGWIEDEFIFRVLLGSSIAPFRILGASRAVLPIENGRLMALSDMTRHELLGSRWIKAWSLWTKHKSEGSELTLLDRVNFHGALSNQLQGDDYRVVYARSGDRTSAVVVADPTLVVDHKLYWMSASSEGEAHYLAGILNSNAVATLLAETQRRDEVRERDIDALPWRLPIPMFDPVLSLHREIELGARRAAAVVDAVPDLADTTYFSARTLVRRALEESASLDDLDSAVIRLLLN